MIVSLIFEVKMNNVMVNVNVCVIEFVNEEMVIIINCIILSIFKINVR